MRQCAIALADFIEEREDFIDSTSPIYDSWLQHGGSEAITTLTNFSEAEFNILWSIVQVDMEEKWLVGRGKKCKTSAKDSLMMALCVLKHYNKWDKHALDFGISASSFEKMTMKVFHIIEKPLYEKFIKMISMTEQKVKGNIFPNYPYALYATDVKFQPSFRPTGQFGEARRYFSNKHKLYGLKIEASVAYPGICIDLSPCDVGSTSDFTMFTQRLELHQSFLKKSENENLREDHGEGSQNYPNMWGVLVDKGYQGAMSILRAIHPKKKPKGGELTREDVERNVRVSSDRVIVENYFGRVCSLWKISRSTYRWSHNSYDVVTRITFALTNFHVSLMPLRAADGEYYKQAVAKYVSQGQERATSRARAQATYRRRRQARLSMQMHSSRNNRWSPYNGGSLSPGY
jgi:hypothetical protein